jgi:hypothetical protein
MRKNRSVEEENGKMVILHDIVLKNRAEEVLKKTEYWQWHVIGQEEVLPTNNKNLMVGLAVHNTHTTYSLKTLIN